MSTRSQAIRYDSGLIRPTRFEHSFRADLAEGRNVVVTSGTGSGKTESFLLPVLARLVAESQ